MTTSFLGWPSHPKKTKKAPKAFGTSPNGNTKTTSLARLKPLSWRPFFDSSVGSSHSGTMPSHGFSSPRKPFLLLRFFGEQKEAFCKKLSWLYKRKQLFVGWLKIRLVCLLFLQVQDETKCHQDIVQNVTSIEASNESKPEVCQTQTLKGFRTSAKNSAFPKTSNILKSVDHFGSWDYNGRWGSKLLLPEKSFCLLKQSKKTLAQRKNGKVGSPPKNLKKTIPPKAFPLRKNTSSLFQRKRSDGRGLLGRLLIDLT